MGRFFPGFNRGLRPRLGASGHFFDSRVGFLHRSGGGFGVCAAFSAMAITSSMEAVDSSAAALISSARARTSRELFEISFIAPATRVIMELMPSTSRRTSARLLRRSTVDVRSPAATSSIFSATRLMGAAMLPAIQRETAMTSSATTTAAMITVFRMALTGARNSATVEVMPRTPPTVGTGKKATYLSSPSKK